MKSSGKVRCDACPVMCYISDGKSGACDRYANRNGRIIRCDPLTVLDNTLLSGGELIPFLKSDWDGRVFHGEDFFVTALGAGTTYPDYKPAPFIVSREIEDVDFVTVVSEAIFSYCGAKIKIDTDRHLGEEASAVLSQGETIGHVTTAEYGSQMFSIGGVQHLTGGSKKEGRVTCETLMQLFNKKPVELTVKGGSSVVVQAGKAPVIDGTHEHRMRVGCGSATIGMFASQWKDLVDEVVVVDDHITGVVSEHQAGKVLGWAPSGISIKGRRSTPGRYFQVAQPGLGWGGTDIKDPLVILGPWREAKGARPGLSMLMVSTTGEQYGYYVLNESLKPIPQNLPEILEPTVALIAENCEPALCSVLFMGGAGGSLRSGVTENPVKLTRSVQKLHTRVSCGGTVAHVWPGGGITIMADVAKMPDDSFGFVPTPAIVAPIEFTLNRDDYRALGGHDRSVRALSDIIASGGEYGSDMRALRPRAQQAFPRPGTN